MKRSGPLKRNTPLRRVSPKTAKRNRARSVMRTTELQQRPYCEARGTIWTADPTYTDCALVSCDLHEPLTRARGGSVLDPENTVAVCRPCHDWIHNHPAQATEIGLLRSATDGC